MRRDTLLVVLLFAFAALGVARMQPRLANATHSVKLRDDIYVLPPPNETRALSMGYTAAAADLLWAKLVVEYGVHMSERREFHPDPYLDSILALDPTSAVVYRFADTLLCYRPMHGDEADARKARAILERGLKEKPGDYEVWNEYGQFVAFLGPSFLTSETEKQAWRKDGALALAKAVTLGADPEKSLAAATLLSDAGESKAAIQNLRRAWIMTDDPTVRAQIQAKLDRANASADNAAQAQAVRFIESQWRAEYPFLSRGTFLLIGPEQDAARCAGPSSAGKNGCERDWDGAIAASE